MKEKKKKYWIKTFGCIQNSADSQRIKTYFNQKGYQETENWEDADMAIINSCVIRESAENRVYGLINNIRKSKKKDIKIILTGCLSGLKKKGEKVKGVDKILPTEKIKYSLKPLRDKNMAAMIPISNGCNNFCSYCIVPYARGKEVSRTFDEIIDEAKKVKTEGFDEVVLIGQNVNSYGADLNSKEETWVSMGKKRFKSLFPKLLKEIAQLGFKKISFMSSNPWDFSDELIEVIASNKNIDRLIHLPLQSGDDGILEKMNRGYKAKDYLALVKKMKKHIAGLRLTTDIIIGFPGENEKAFGNTVSVCKKVGFEIAYLNKYSPRKGTVSAKLYADCVPQDIKKRRWLRLEKLINKKLI